LQVKSSKSVEAICGYSTRIHHLWRPASAGHSAWQRTDQAWSQ